MAKTGILLMAKFSFSSCNVEVEFAPEAIKKLSQYRQLRSCIEAGGFLFTSDLYREPILVEDISVPSPKDKRTRARFIPHKKIAQETINNMFERGFHYIGDWHTHPQNVPKPSWTDIRTIKDVFKKSKHGLNFMLMLILSNSEFEKSFLGLTDGEGIFKSDK